MITLTQITNTDNIFIFTAVLVFKLLSFNILFMNKKRQQKIANFMGKLLQNYKQLRSFQDTFEKHKQSLISTFSICMTIDGGP